MGCVLPCKHRIKAMHSGDFTFIEPGVQPFMACIFNIMKEYENIIEIENIAETLFKKRRPFLFQHSDPNTTPVKLNALQVIKYPWIVIKNTN